MSSGESAIVDVAEDLVLSAQAMSLLAARRASLYAGSGVSATSQDMEMSAGGSVDMFSSESASISSGRVSVAASDGVSVETRDLDFSSNGKVDLAASGEVSVGGHSVSVSSTDALSVSAAGGMGVGAASDVTLQGGGGLKGTFAGSAEVISGEFGVSSAGSVYAVASTGASVASGGDMSFGSIGTAE